MPEGVPVVIVVTVTLGDEVVSGGWHRAKHSKAVVRACLAKTEEQTTVPLCDYFTCGTVVSKFWNLKETVICLGVTERNYHIQTGSEPELKQNEY